MNNVKDINKITKQRIEVLNKMKKSYLKFHAEDLLEGTNFDCDVLGSFDLLIKKYEKKLID